MKIKKLEDCMFSEIIDMSREDFDESLAISEMNVGSLESLRKLISLQYDKMSAQISALSELIVNRETPEESRTQANETIKNMYLIMFSMEYKATAIYNVVKEAQEQLS